MNFCTSPHYSTFQPLKQWVLRTIYSYSYRKAVYYLGTCGLYKQKSVLFRFIHVNLVITIAWACLLYTSQIQINTKHDTIFKALNIENTQNTKTYTTITHNNTTLKYQRPINNLNSNQQPTHKYFTRNKIAKAEDERTGTLKTCSK